MPLEVKEYIPKINEKPIVEITDKDKFNHTFVVKPTNDGFVFYEVTVSKGAVPKQLQSKYSRMRNAVKDVTNYIENSKPTPTVRRDLNTKRRENDAERQGKADK